MSDEVRSNSSTAPPDTGGPRLDPVDGPKSLEIEFPTPDLELADSRPIRAEEGKGTDAGPPPPSQRQASPQRLEPLTTPVPPSPPSPQSAVTNPVPIAPFTPTLPAPAPVLQAPLTAGFVPPSPALPFVPVADPRDEPDDWGSRPTPLPGAVAPSPLAPNEGAPSPLAQDDGSFYQGSFYQGAVHQAAHPQPPVAHGPTAGVTEPAPPPRMLSEPVPLTRTTASAPPSKNTLRPGLVEPKRIIEVLGSNVPVLDTALEEEAIEDLDDSEARELAEPPSTEVPVSPPDAELDLPVVVEDEGPLAAPRAAASAAELDADAVALATDPAPPGPELGAAPSGSSEAAAPEGAEAAAKRVKVPPNKRRRPPPPSSRSAEMRKVDPSPPGARKWWEEMFSEEFLRAIPILSPKQLEREVAFIDEALGVDRGARILDLACGAGQHAVELASRGYDLVGFDLSQSQLDWAGGLAQERNQRLQFTYGDMRDLSYLEAFDAVYSWNTSFGFFEEEKNVDVAQRVFRALRPGGRFLLDVINRDFVVAQQPGQTWFEGDGCVCIDDVSIDFITSRMKVKRTLMLTNGKNRECNYSVRIYGLHELGKMLHDVGFKVLNVSGRPEMPGVFFGATSPRIIILAVKP
jgi:SAM-dependent methyltransferase